MELSPERLEKLEKLLKNAPSKISIFITHRDPDSVASAVAKKKKCESLGKSVSVFYGDEPIFPQTQAIITLCHLNYFIPAHEFTPGKDSDFIILVDSPSLIDSRLGAEINIKPRIIIDHHEKPADLPPEDDDHWYWFEPCGSCATLISYLMFTSGVSFTPGDLVATLLMIGIKNDTAETNSLDMSPFDYHMLAKLSDYGDQKLIYDISLSAIEESFWDIIHIASSKENRKRVGATFIACLGEISPNHEYNMVRIAEMMLKTKGVTTAYAWAINGSQLVIKARNTDKEIPLNQRIKEIFGEKNGAKDYAGAGSARMDLGQLCDAPDRESLLKVVKSWLESKLLH